MRCHYEDGEGLGHYQGPGEEIVSTVESHYRLATHNASLVHRPVASGALREVPAISRKVRPRRNGGVVCESRDAVGG
jgi:hypothetical protein